MHIEVLLQLYNYLEKALLNSIQYYNLYNSFNIVIYFLLSNKYINPLHLLTVKGFLNDLQTIETPQSRLASTMGRML